MNGDFEWHPGGSHGCFELTEYPRTVKWTNYGIYRCVPKLQLTIKMIAKLILGYKTVEYRVNLSTRGTFLSPLFISPQNPGN